MTQRNLTFFIGLLAAGLCLRSETSAQPARPIAGPGPVVVPPAIPSRSSAVPSGLHRRAEFRADLHTRDLGSLPADEIAAVDAAHARRFGRIHPGPARVGLSRSLGRVPIVLTGGAAQRFDRPDGTHVWLWAVRSPGAFGMRLHFSRFEVGDGSVFVFAEDRSGGAMDGPFAGRGLDARGEFWTKPIPGELVYVEVAARGEVVVELDEVIHFDREFAAHFTPPDLASCHLDVMCYGPAAVSPTARDATVQLMFNLRVVNGITTCTVCSGTLLEDLDGDTAVPYLLTAYHCLNQQQDVDTLVTTFFWQKDACNGVLPDYNRLPKLSGGTLLAANPTDGGNDMAFIRLPGSAPAGATFAPWNAGDVSYNVYGIHHPYGDWKRVTFSVTDPILACQINQDEDEYHFVRDVSGRIEPGSSGSGLFDDQGRLVGQLYGACWGLTGNPPDCGDTDNWRDSYGQFSVTYPMIQRWLEIGGTIHADAAYQGDELGTPTQPFNTVTESHAFAWEGTRIKLKTGNYADRLTLNKRLVLKTDGGPATIGR